VIGYLSTASEREVILRFIRTIGFFISLAGATAPLALGTAHAQGDEHPALVARFADWGVYAGTRGGHKVCFAMSQPTTAETNPPNRPRDPIYLFVTTRPADNVREEISVIMGYPLKPGSDAGATVDGARFALQTRADNAWVKNVSEEARLVDSMRHGHEAIVTGVSTRGTQTTDHYSLKGITQALERVAQECR
jgi:invasion protein IalB